MEVEQLPPPQLLQSAQLHQGQDLAMLSAVLGGGGQFLFGYKQCCGLIFAYCLTNKVQTRPIDSFILKEAK